MELVLTLYKPEWLQIKCTTLPKNIKEWLVFLITLDAFHIK